MSQDQPDAVADSDYILDRASNLPKMPVSFLQELCIRRETKPLYELLSSEGQVHSPTFVFRVSVGDLSATGHGKNKKTAKHLAAKAMLEHIVAIGRYEEFGIGDTQEEALEALSNLTDVSGEPSAGRVSGEEANSPAAAAMDADDGDGPGNPVGKLQEYCQQHKMVSPAYEVIHEEGPPHSRTFVVKITHGKLSAEGSGQSKKLAKRDAAVKFLKILASQPLGENRDDGALLAPEDELIEKFKEAMASLEQKVKPISQEEKECSETFFNTLKRDHNDCFDALRSLFASSSADHTVLLMRIAKTCNFGIEYFPSEVRSSLGDYQCLVQLSCAMPVAVCYGRGATAECARQAAAFNALEYLKIMTNE